MTNTTKLGRVGLVLKGEYNASTQYEKLDVIIYNGSSYVAKQNAQGILPTDTTYWQPITDISASIDAINTAIDSANDATQKALDAANSVSNAVQDVQINGASIVNEGIANIPKATLSELGAIKANLDYGIGVNANGELYCAGAENSLIDERSSQYKPIIPTNLDYAVKSAMCDGKGEAWTETEQASARERIGIKEMPIDEQMKKFFTNYYAMKRTGKVYQTKLWKFATNPTTEGEKLLDNAGLVFEPSTDTVEGRDDYLNGQHPLFEWVYVNYKRYPDGTAYPIAIEGSPDFKTTGDVDVGAMQMEFYWNVEETDEYFLYTISDSPNEALGLKPWIEGVRANGEVLPWCIGSAYYSGIASDGLLRSQPDLPLENFQSFNNMLENYPKKGEGYHGAGIERNTFQILFNAIKGATKSSQTLYAGCTSYNWQYQASIKRDTLESYFPVTTAQANNIVVGSGVYVGYADRYSGTTTNLNLDRGLAIMRAYTPKIAKVLKIEQIDETNSAVYLDCEPFSTADVTTGEIVSPVYITSMEWHSGSTNKVIGKHDGSYLSNTNSKMPYRVQGREYLVGAWDVSANTIMEFNSDYTTNVYVAPKGATITNDMTIVHNDWKLIGVIPSITDNADYWIGDISIDTETGGWYPSAVGASNVQGTGDRCYRGGKVTSGTREFLSSGCLWYGSYAGSSCLSCGGGLSWAGWDFCGAD